MKTFMNLLVLTFTIALISCGDIVDSDSNIKKTSLDYSSVLDNQETGVIMPLKVGNKWLYKVTEYFSTGEIYSSYYDSIVVKSEEYKNGEKWYKVYLPMLTTMNDVYITNTDKGLWFINDNPISSYLIANYPIKYSKYRNGELLFRTRLFDNSIFSDSSTRYLSSNVDNSIFNNLRSTHQYKQTYYLKETKREILSSESYFAENYGILKYNLYVTDLMKANSEPQLWKSYELTELGNECANDTTVNSGLLNDIGRQVVKIKLTNNFANSISVNSSDIKIEDNEKVEIEIIPLSFPITINPGQSVDLELSIIKKISGSFNSEIYVNSNLGCWYRINLLAYFN